MQHNHHLRSSRFFGILTIVVTLACWTSIPLFLRHFKPFIDGWTANGWRYAISALVWLPAIVVSWRRGTMPPGLWRASMIPSVLNAAAQICFGLAPYYIDPGLMTFSLRAQIVFLTLGALAFFPSERKVIRSPFFLVGLGMIVAGTALTLMLGEGGLGGGTNKPLGVGLSILSGALYAGYALGVRKWMHGMNPITAFAAVSQITAILIVAAMFVFAPTTWHSPMDASVFPRIEFLYLIVSALVGIGIGHTLYFYSIGSLGLAASSGVVQLQPITVSIGSLLLFGERLTSLQWMTGVAAVTGAGIMLWAQDRIHRADMSRTTASTVSQSSVPSLRVEPT